MDFNMNQIGFINNEFVDTLDYRVRGFYFVPLKCSYSKILYIFKKVFSSANVGVVAMEPKDYDTIRWWTSSAGVRDIISEAAAYLYVRWIFYPSN